MVARTRRYLRSPPPVRDSSAIFANSAMGSFKIQTTFDVYGHLLPGSYNDVRARMGAFLATERLPAG